jgi:poly(A) polymerase
MRSPRIIPRDKHSISRGYIDPDALRVLYRLHKAGYKAYLVGGSVRDLMTGRTPKDFDVGTDARPQEVRRLLRNSRIIGRRFRLVHVLFEHGKVVEVSTFRRRPDVEPSDANGEADADILIRSDNTFGTPEEDAKRRDFTINGLFYDIATFSVLDYVGGVEDLEASLVRTIGDPVIRFREDPVRMLRACEFAARLDFRMTPDVIAAIASTKGEIRKSAAPRVTEELLDPLRRGWGTGTYKIWSEMGILQILLPELENEIGPRANPASPSRIVFWKMLADADARRQKGEFLSDATLLGMVFIPLVLAAIRLRAGDGKPIDPSRILLVLEEVVNPVAARLALSNLTVHLVKQALYTLGRLVETRPGDAMSRKLVTKAYFPPAVSILSLYADATGRYQDASAAWQDVMARAGHRAKADEDLSYAPFPEALVPPPMHERAPHEFPGPPRRASARPRHRHHGPRRGAGKPA